MMITPSTTTENKKGKKTREAMLRERVVIRLALDETGPMIAAILKDNGVELPGADWNHVFPHWLIACDGDDVIGCVMVMPAKPVGYAEFLLVKPSVSFKLRAIAIRKLIIAAMATVQAGKASYVACNIAENNEKFSGVIEKLGVSKFHRRTLYVKRLTP